MPAGVEWRVSSGGGGEGGSRREPLAPGGHFDAHRVFSLCLASTVQGGEQAPVPRNGQFDGGKLPGRLRPVGPCQPELNLGADRFPADRKWPVVGRTDDSFVESDVQVAELREILGGLLLVDHLLEFLRRCFVETCCQQTRGHDLEGAAHGEEVFEIHLRKDADPAAAAAVKLDEALLLDLDESFTHRHPADCELFSEGGFGEGRAGGELSGDDGAPDSGGGVFGEAVARERGEVQLGSGHDWRE